MAGEAAVAASGAEAVTGAPESAGAAATAPAEAAPRAPPEPKTWKVGDRVVSDPDELYAYAEQARVERQAVEKAQQESARAREFMRLLKEDPRSVLSDPSIGHDLKKLAVDILKEQMEEESLSPEQKRIRELERSLKAREEQERKAKEATEAKQREAAEQEARQYYVKVLTDAMDQARLPKTDANARRMAALMLKQHEMGLDLPPVAIARLIEREVEEEHAAMYDAMDPKELLRRFPKLADKLRRAQLESLNVAPPAPTEEQPASRPPSKEKSGPIDFREAQRLIRERLK